jgi:hypothetical protein
MRSIDLISWTILKQADIFIAQGGDRNDLRKT